MPGYPAPQLLPGGGCESDIYRVWMYILRKGFMEVVGGRGMGMNGMEDAVVFQTPFSASFRSLGFLFGRPGVLTTRQ